MQLTDITQSLSTSLMASIQTIDRLNQRIKALEDQQKTQQLCLAKSLLALGTLAQNIENESTQTAVFKILEEALGEIRKANPPSSTDSAAPASTH